MSTSIAAISWPRPASSSSPRADQRGVALAEPRRRRPIGAAIRVGRLDHGEPVGPLGLGVRIGGQLTDEFGVAVIRALGDHHAVMAGDDPGDLHRQVVGLGAGAHEVALRQLAGQARTEAFGQLDHVMVQVAGVGVDEPRLPAQRVDDPRVGVADRGHVVVAVEVAPTVGIVDPHALAADEMHRLVVEQLVAGCEPGGPPADQIGVRHRRPPRSRRRAARDRGRASTASRASRPGRSSVTASARCGAWSI